MVTLENPLKPEMVCVKKKKNVSLGSTYLMTNIYCYVGVFNVTPTKFQHRCKIKRKFYYVYLKNSLNILKINTVLIQTQPRQNFFLFLTSAHLAYKGGFYWYSRTYSNQRGKTEIQSVGSPRNNTLPKLIL